MPFFKKVKSKVSKSEEQLVAKSHDVYDSEAIDAANTKRLRKAVAKHALKRFDEREAKISLHYAEIKKMQERVKVGTNTRKDDRKLEEYYSGFHSTKLEDKQEEACGGDYFETAVPEPDFFLNPESERRRKKIAKKAKKVRSKERALEP